MSYQLNDTQPVRIRNDAGEYPETLDPVEFTVLRIAIRDHLDGDNNVTGEDHLEGILEKLERFDAVEAVVR